MQIKDQIEESRNNKSFLHIKNYFNNLPKWSNFINNINYKFNSESLSQINEERILKNKTSLTDILIYNKLDIQVMHAVSTVENGYVLNKLFDDLSIIEFLEEQSSSYFGNIKTLINFIGSEAEYSIHSDNHDVILIQCEGSIEWRIYKSLKDTEYQSYIIEPGDLIFAPSGIVHQAVINNPRASIVFDHNYS